MQVLDHYKVQGIKNENTAHELCIQAYQKYRKKSRYKRKTKYYSFELELELRDFRDFSSRLICLKLK